MYTNEQFTTHDSAESKLDVSVSIANIIAIFPTYFNYSTDILSQ